MLRESPELRISDLASCFDITLNGVSKHVKVLERAGLVVRRVDGRVHWIRAHWRGLDAPLSWLNSHQMKRLATLMIVGSLGASTLLCSACAPDNATSVVATADHAPP